MSIQMQLWRIEGDHPKQLTSAKLDLESRLERWICEDLSLVGEGLLLLGQQVVTAYGHAIDILALDREVATELDAQSERIVQFLSSQYGVNLNVIYFDYYRHGDQEFVGRSWLIAPEEVERKANTAGSSRKRALLTLEDLASLAADHGVGELYRPLHEGLSRLSDHVATTQSNASYRWRTPAGGRVALVSVYPKVSGPEAGLMADIRVDDLARQFDLDPATLHGALPEKLRRGQIPGLYLYGDGYPFRSAEEIDRFLRTLEGGEGEAGASNQGNLGAE